MEKQAPTVNRSKKPSPEVLAKLAEGYRYVTIPSLDIYENPFHGITIQGGHGSKGDQPGFENHYGPGTHLLSPDFADEVESRLRIWEESMLRIMRPGAHRSSVDQATRRGVTFDPNPPETVA